MMEESFAACAHEKYNNKENKDNLGRFCSQSCQNLQEGLWCGRRLLCSPPTSQGHRYLFKQVTTCAILLTRYLCRPSLQIFPWIANKRCHPF